MKNTNKQRGEIIIYQGNDRDISIDVKLENDNVWLTQAQMALLFDRERSVITKHINKVFQEGELELKSNVHFLHIAKSDKPIAFYNLDVIISVGYRVKSQRGTQFRIWANKILKDYLVKGYAIKNNLQTNQYNDLQQTIKLLSNVIQNKKLSIDEAKGLLQVITDYSYALSTLDKYDFQKLNIENTTKKEQFKVTYENSIMIIKELKRKFNESLLFANEKDNSFKSSIATIYQTFDRQELYPSVEEKAAMLLYLVTKNHSFTDGNKRIAAFLFLWFLNNNGILYKPDGRHLIENNTLVALTLMIAESRSEEKDIMVKVVVNLINKDN